MAIYGNSQTIAIVLNAIHINTLYNTYGNMAILFKKKIFMRTHIELPST